MRGAERKKAKRGVELAAVGASGSRRIAAHTAACTARRCEGLSWRSPWVHALMWSVPNHAWRI